MPYTVSHCDRHPKISAGKKKKKKGENVNYSKIPRKLFWQSPKQHFALQHTGNEKGFELNAEIAFLWK
jgi:hypothetical protein